MWQAHVQLRSGERLQVYVEEQCHYEAVLKNIDLQVNDMYETLQLNGHKIDHKDDVRRDDMQEAAANFARNLALGKVCIGLWKLQATVLQLSLVYALNCSLIPAAVTGVMCFFQEPPMAVP